MLKKETVLLILLGLFSTYLVWASDTHQDGQTHKITYTVTTISGDPVSSLTVRTAVNRASDNSFYDWSDGTFKSSGWTTRLKTMTYNTIGEFYETTISIDQATLASNDYTVTVSNDDATYGDYQAETFGVNPTENIIKVHR